MDVDIRMTVAVLVAAASAWLAIVIVRKILDGVDKATCGAFYAKPWVKKLGVFFDTLLPVLPCVPSGFLALAIMSYWPPEGLWDNKLLYFLIGALAGSVASQIYQLVTRGIHKQAERAMSSIQPPPDKS